MTLIHIGQIMFLKSSAKFQNYKFYGFIRSNEFVVGSGGFFDSTLQILILECLVEEQHRPFCIL